MFSSIKKIILSSLVCLPCAAFADVQVFIDSDLDVSSAVGLILSRDGTRQVTETAVNRLENGLWMVSFPFSSDDPDVMVTAMVGSADGKIAFGEVRPANVPDQKKLMLEMPPCPDTAPPANPNMEQLGLLQKLVEVRSTRRELTQIKVSRIMEGQFLEKLRRLEDGFGLGQDRELTPNLPSVELVNRLARITNAIKNYELHKDKDSK